MQHSAQIVIERLPKGWVYLLSKNDVRALVQAHPDSLRLVSHGGTGGKASKYSGRHSPGSVTAVPTDSGWVFRLNLWGVPEETIGDEGQAHRVQLLQRIGDFLRAYQETRSGSGLDPMRLGFNLAPGEDGFELTFHEGRVERLLLPFLEEETWWR